MRKEPGEDGGIWGLIQKDETVEAVVEESSDEWLAIEYEGELGYISSEYVTTEFLVDNGETFAEIEERKKREQEERNKLTYMLITFSGWERMDATLHSILLTSLNTNVASLMLTWCWVINSSLVMPPFRLTL